MKSLRAKDGDEAEDSHRGRVELTKKFTSEIIADNAALIISAYTILCSR